VTKARVSEPLIAALLSYPAIHHITDIRDKADDWLLAIYLERSEVGWHTLEWLTWAITNDWGGEGFAFYPHAEFPPENENSLCFVLGGDKDAMALALFLGEQLKVWKE